MKAKLFSLVLSMVIVASASAQSDYQSSIGIRFGGGYYDMVGVAYKTFISSQAALEFDLGVKPSVSYGGFTDGVTNLSLSGAYQHHFPIANVEGLQWFVGGGAIVANTFSDWEDYQGLSVGIFPTGGADYKLKNAPFAFSLDVRPTFHFVRSYGGINNFLPNGGVTARYTF